MSSQIVTGFYRYTDIWFDWPRTLPPEGESMLKAILAHDALVHPEHPLHVEGVDGAQLYIGTLFTGEARLLFSSAQVDYIRYWLHAMGLTKEVIPLPYSDCLLTREELKTIAPTTYADGSAVRNAIKNVDKNNKRLKGTGFNKTLTYRRHAFECVRNLWVSEKGVFCAIDFEAWEMDHTEHTEFGFRLVGWEDGQKIESCGHYIVAGSSRNSKYVPDYRHAYQFGKSETLSKGEFKKRIFDLITDLLAYGTVFLVFHDDKQDIKYLNQLKAPLDNLSYMVPDSMPSSGLFVVDTADLIGALMGEASGNNRSLEKMCHLLQQRTSFLHNAGNDAYHTLGCMIEMASGDQVDAQREKRWPNQTKEGSLWVKVKPGQECSDDEDEEAGLGSEPKLGFDPVTRKLYRTDMLDSDGDEDGF